MQQDLAFLDAIRERPGLQQDRQVYADWLEERGDPLGTLIHLQCDAARLAAWSPRRLALEAEAHQLLLQHETSWLGPLAGHVSNWEFRGGLLAWVTVKAETFLAHAEKWLPALPLLGVHLRQAHGHVAALAACPRLLHLNNLYLGDNDLTDDDLRLLVNSPHLRRLRELYLHANRFSKEGIRELASSPHLPRLRVLSLANCYFEDEGLMALVGTPHLQRLRHLNLMVLHLDTAGLRALANSALLGRLRELYLGGGMVPGDRLKILVESPAFAGVRRLVYDLNQGVDADVAALAASPHARNLTVLSLASNRHLTDASLTALAASPHLKRLRALSFGHCEYGPAGLVALGRSRTLESLRSLHLSYGMDRLKEGYPSLFGGRLARQLRDLSLDSDAVGPKGLEALAAHPAPLRLRRCRLYLGEEDVAGWEALLAKGSLSRLTDLTVAEMPRATLLSLISPGRLPELRKLRVYGMADVAEIQSFLESPLLRQLHDLSLAPAEDELGLDILRRLKASAATSPLRELSLGWTLTPEQVEVLTGGQPWPQLTTLKIGSFQLGKEGVQLLAAWPGLRQLRFLTLRNCSVLAVPGLEVLAGCPNVSPLLRVDIQNGSVAPESRPVLRQHLPGRVSSERPLPRVLSLGGWGKLLGDEE